MRSLPLSLSDNLADSSQDFSLTTAYFMARLSALAYKEYSEISQCFAGSSAEVLTGYDTDGTFCFLVDYGSFRVLVFRGTEPDDPDDLLADLRFRKSHFHHGLEGRTHRGFLIALKKVWAALQKDLNEKSTPLYVTGHSLGGALATIFAASFLSQNQHVEHCLTALYTFGSPRCGDPDFSSYLDVKVGVVHHRIVNGLDIVPMLPLLTMNYKHSGKLHYITGSGKLRSGITICAQLADQVVSAFKTIWAGDGFKRWVPWAMITSHSIKSYIYRLEGIHLAESEGDKNA